MASSKAQASVELMAILGISLIVILAFSVLSSDFLSDINVNKNYADAHDAVQQIVNAADNVYAQGEGASISVWVKIPSNANLTSTLSYIGRPSDAPAGTPSNSVNLRVGETDVRAIAKETVVGSFPQVPGVYQIRIVSKGNYVAIGNHFLDVDKSSIYESMAPDEVRSETITLTAVGNETMHVVILPDWGHASSVTLDPSSLTEFDIAPGNPQAVVVTISALTNSGGLYNGQLVITSVTQYGVEGAISVNETFAIPITADVQNNNGNSLQVGMSSLLAGQAGQPYNFVLTASGGTEPYTWEATGLPSGLSLETSGDIVKQQGTGQPGTTTQGTSQSGTTKPGDPVPIGVGVKGATVSIVGTPDTPGTYIVTLTVTDGAGLKATKRISLIVAAEIVSSCASSGQECTVLECCPGCSCQTTCDVMRCAAFDLSSCGDGIIQGSEECDDGNCDNNDACSNICTLNPLEITTTSLPDGTEGVKYSATLEATGGTPPYTWDVVGLPPDLKYDSNTGGISQTPKAGTSGSSPYSIDITVTDTVAATATATLGLKITGGATPLAITTSSPLQDGECNAAYTSLILTATGGTEPYTWTVSNLPHGLHFDGTQTIEGTPDESGGPCSICVQLDDSAAGHTYAELSLSITGGMMACGMWSCHEIVCN
ncbi:MAG: putative Ig domain-containing protein [Candidatus Micrarchaeota archaeon]|nr:putative Ig domain-containing protein [Candidatus Micrarchaeota archaeon]